jgi:hypothetical protein
MAEWQTYSRFLDTVGDGSGFKNAIGDYSAAIQRFLFQPATAGRPINVNTLQVQVADTAILSDSYGDGIVLANGIRVYVQTRGRLIELTDDVPIITNQDWGRFTQEAVRNDVGAGDGYLRVRWMFGVVGRPIELFQESADFLAVDLNDDFSGLSKHYFLAQGSEYVGV